MVLNDCLVLWLQLKGQCQDSALVGGITAVLEQGTPVQMIQLLQSPWEERFRVRTSTWPPPLPPHLLWSVNQEFPTHSPPQGIPGAGGGWKFSGLTEALSPNHLSLINTLRDRCPSQISWLAVKLSSIWLFVVQTEDLIPGSRKVEVVYWSAWLTRGRSCMSVLFDFFNRFSGEMVLPEGAV